MRANPFLQHVDCVVIYPQKIQYKHLRNQDEEVDAKCLSSVENFTL